MRKNVCFWGLMFLLWTQGAWGQNKTVVEIENDSLCFVNPRVNIGRTNYDLTLTFKSHEVVGHSYIKIEWGDGSGPTVINLASTSDGQLQNVGFKHTYSQQNNFPIRITLFPAGTYTEDQIKNETVLPDKELHKWAVNRLPNVEFSIEPVGDSENEGCLNHGTDTFRLVLKNPEYNPPKTQYIILASSGVPLVDHDSVVAFAADEEANYSSLIIFEEATGTYGAEFQIEMHCPYVSDAGKQEVLKAFSVDRKRIYVYDTVDLRQVYRTIFDAPFPDTMRSNFLICAPDRPAEFSKRDNWLKKYQWLTHMSDEQRPDPLRRLDFNVNFFYTDSVQQYSPESEIVWKDVTDSLNYVDSSMLFYHSGFYKMLITASNKCSQVDEVSGQYIRDSLWTDWMYKSNGDLDVLHRYMQVFENNGAKLHYLGSDTVCMNVNDTVWFVDGNRRKYYDPRPKYEFELTRNSIVCSSSDYEALSPKIYKNGKVLSGSDGFLDQAGCDSTVQQLVFKKPGSYVVRWARITEQCGEDGEKSKTFSFVVGDVPAVKDTLLTAFFADTRGFTQIRGTRGVAHCDTFTYVLPDLKKAILGNNMDVDSTAFRFKTADGDSVIIQESGISRFTFSNFGDDTAQIRLRVHNYCGWGGVDSVFVYNYTQPRVEIWRDSVKIADTLCVNFSYPYHLVGNLPKQYADSVAFSKNKSTQIGGKDAYWSTEDMTEWFSLRDKEVVKHLNKGIFQEKYHIINTATKVVRCEQLTASMPIVVMDAPDTIIYRDSVLYCNSFTELNTKQLFHAPDTVFNGVVWQWQGTTTSKRFPVLDFDTKQADTLRVRTWQSNVCRIDHQLIFIPKPLPDAGLPLLVDNICVPDTLSDYTRFMKSDHNLGERGMIWQVYKDVLTADSLLYDSQHPDGLVKWGFSTTTKDSIRLIYALQDTLPKGIWGDCKQIDTVKLRIYSPRLKVKKADTLDYGATQYNFSRVTGFVDTLNLDGSALTWDWAGNTGGPVAANGSYNLTAVDWSQDSLKFALNGTTRCGDAISDTLIVYVPHARISAHTDTVCNNVADYLLWREDRTTGNYVDTNTLKWTILQKDGDNFGTLTNSGNGKNVCFNGNGTATFTDVIKIKVEGKFNSAETVPYRDTVLLGINEAVKIDYGSFVSKTDTLLMDEDWEMNFYKIKTKGLKFANYAALESVLISGDVEQSPGRDSILYFPGDIVSATQNQKGSFRIVAEGLKGCENDTTPVLNAMGLAMLTRDLKQNPVTLCSGDSVRMDSILVLKGEDRYTRKSWSVGYEGSFNADTTVFRASTVTEFREGGLELVYTKAFWTYDSVYVSDLRGLSEGPLRIKTHIFGEPSLSVLHDRDTLCASDAEISVPIGGTGATNVWVAVTEAYKDSVRFNGKKLIDGKYSVGKNPGETDTVVVMANLGKCTKWNEEKKDTIYLYRFDSRIKKVDVPAVCEDGSQQITAELNEPYANYYWRHDASGTLDTAGKRLQPVYSAGVYVEGAERYVTLYAQPTKPGCLVDSQRMEITVNRLPEIEAGLVSDTVCGIAGNTVTTTLSYESGRTDIDTVRWFVKGESTPFAEKTTPDWSAVYTLKTADVTRGYVEFVALAVPKLPCKQTGIYDTVKQVLQSPPTIKRVDDLFLCQGQKFSISDIVVAEHEKTLSWSIKTGGGTIENDTFVSNESDLNISFTIRAEGWHNCSTVSQDVSVTLNKAPLPQIQFGSDLCQKSAIELKATVVASQYKWVFDGDDTHAQSGSTTSFAFDAAGVHRITLIQIYNHSGGSCTRELAKNITVQPRPQASFTYDAQVAVNRPVTFVNTSLPEAVRATGHWWIGSTDQGVKQDLTYTFPMVVSGVKVSLIVANVQGCKDTASHQIEVVGAPHPKFDVTVDSCARTVDFADKSDHYGSVIRWDFGDGTTSSDRNPAQKVYPELIKDSVYTVTLSLKNAADSVTFQRKVKIISALKKVDFVIQPDPSDCQQKIAKEIVFDIQGHTTHAYVDWGDGSAPVVFDGNVLVGMTHDLRNESPNVIRDTIKLYAENQCWKDSASHSLEIYPLSVKAGIDVSGNEVCFGEENLLGFKNVSRGFNKNGGDCSWSWKFEPEKPFEQQNVDSAVYAFRRPGVYDIMLSMRDHCNEDTAHVRVRVKGNDSLYFDILPYPYCSGEEITMKFRQLGASEFSDLEWSVDGYRVSTGGDDSQIKNVFTIGNHSVKLAGKADGCLDEKTRYFKVNETPKPVISLTGGPDNGCEPFEVNFRAENYGRELRPHIVWDFKNGVASLKERDTVVFEHAGTYQVALTMTSDSGCVKTVEKTITVKHSPRISFDLNDSLFCTQDGSFSVELTNTSEDLDECQFEWYRAVGEGGREYLTNNEQPAIQYFENLYGPVDFVLKAVYLANGCPAEYTRQVIASEKVKADIFKDAEYVCLDNAVTFVNQSENGTKSYWDMGDGTQVRENSFEHVYEKVGDHWVRMITENKDGCKDSVKLKITVYPLPYVDFSWMKDNSVIGNYPDSLNLPKVDNGGVNFTNHSSVYPDDWGTALFYRWNFGDTTFSVDVNPKHQFKNNGHYEVWLTATTEYGCRDSMSDVVSIEAVKGLFIPTAFAPALPDEGMGEGNDYRGVARFQPKGIGLHSYKITVYDLWGTCVWASEALENGCPTEYWDGKFNGADLPKGTYVWKVSAVFIDGTMWNGSGSTEGSVILIR